MYRWCSWCLQPAGFELSERRLTSRNKYQCSNCGRSAVSCTRCQGMARVHADWEDKLCLRCDDPKPEEVVAEVWCSWCTESTMHRLRQRHTWKRDLFNCSRCGKLSIKCKGCGEAHARARDEYHDDYCLKCCCIFSGWGNRTNSSQMATFGWCSWCIEKAEHVLEAPSRNGRHMFSCSNCNGLTVNCKTCRMGLARATLSLIGSKCIQCSGEHVSWEHAWQQKRLPRSSYMYS
eukprot:TRINITY_DN60996_c0_g1_i1.p1 TRINITY_DN60996_c0_g1~~TRINITY_DN60996_c0_g1_i1.p1  ORF type:complete len:233 (+),score=13.17 TRINITY_DN60996_c0_g1_i1:187-885(+)